MKSYNPKQSDITREWHLLDLTGKILGREATGMAEMLIGKKKAYYVPHLDCGDYVVAVNAEKLKLTGKKESSKFYHRHSGYPGGQKITTFKKQMEKDARKVVELAVSRMLPKNKLRKQRLGRLKVFKTEKHLYADKF